MGSSPMALIDTTPVDLNTVAVIEAAEARAWADSYAAAPPEFAEAAGLGYSEVGGALALRWSASGRRYFSRTIGLGVVEPASAAAVDRILEGYADAGITMFLLQLLPHCRPTAYEGWLPDRGLEPFDAQDRVFRDARSVDPGSVPSSVRELAVERVDLQTADEWAEYLQRIYGLDTGPWLPRLIGRPGWHQYVVREEGRIVGARGMYIGPDGMAWLGMNAPVPGVMAQDYQPDAAICAFLVEDGARVPSRHRGAFRKHGRTGLSVLQPARIQPALCAHRAI